MPIDLEKFKIAYEKWVEESLPDRNIQNQERILFSQKRIVN
jgi:hypothetical protein